jgi:hypothetical protein
LTSVSAISARCRTTRCRRTDASVASLPLASAAERDDRLAVSAFVIASLASDEPKMLMTSYPAHANIGRVSKVLPCLPVTQLTATKVHNRKETFMSTEKSDLLKRLVAKGLLQAPEELQQSGEDGSGNNKVKVSGWDVSIADGDRLATGCVVTPVSAKNPISRLLMSATAVATDKLAVLASVTLTGSPSEEAVSMGGWTGVYDPSIDGNVIDSLIWGFVKVGDTEENFSFEKRFVLPT